MVRGDCCSWTVQATKAAALGDVHTVVASGLSNNKQVYVCEKVEEKKR